MLTECHQWCHQSSYYSSHAFSAPSHYESFDIQALWVSAAQSRGVSRLDLAGAWVTGREDHFTPVRSHSHPAWAQWKTPIRGPAFALRPVWPLQPPASIFSGHVHMYALHIYIYASPLHYFLILPQPLRSAWFLTCILRGTLLTYLPTTEIQSH